MLNISSPARTQPGKVPYPAATEDLQCTLDLDRCPVESKSLRDTLPTCSLVPKTMLFSDYGSHFQAFSLVQNGGSGDEGCYMKDLYPGAGVLTDEKLNCAIRQCLDSQRRVPEPRPDHRAESRKRLQAFCTISIAGSIKQSTGPCEGKTHGVAEDGMAVLAERRFAPGSAVQIEVRLPEGPTVMLSGLVVDSTGLDPRSYLTRIRFCNASPSLPSLKDEGAAQGPEPSLLTNAKGDDVGSPSVQETDLPQQRQERDLRTLRSVAKTGIASKETFRDVARLTLSPDHVVRRATISALFQIRGSQAEQALINLLKDPNATIQAEAAETLGHLEAQSAIRPLTELLDHRNEESALRAAEALGRLGDRSGLHVAVTLLRSDHELTPLAARALGTIVKRRFRPGQRGVVEARRFLKQETRLRR